MAAPLRMQDPFAGRWGSFATRKAISFVNGCFCSQVRASFGAAEKVGCLVRWCLGMANGIDLGLYFVL